MITSTDRMGALPSLAWIAEYAWRNFDTGMVGYLRSTGRSHLCRLVWRGVDLRLMEPVIEAQFDELLTDEVDQHLAVFDRDRSDANLEAVQLSW